MRLWRGPRAPRLGDIQHDRARASIANTRARAADPSWNALAQQRGGDRHLLLGQLMRCLFIIAAIVAAGSAHAQEAGNPLNLVCDGGGSVNKSTTDVAQGWNNWGGSAAVIATRRSTVGFDDQLQLWIEGGQGKARLTRVMLPKLRGGDGGWFGIKDIRISGNEIAGSVAVNFANHPKLILDRIAGTVTLSGR